MNPSALKLLLLWINVALTLGLMVACWKGMQAVEMNEGCSAFSMGEFLGVLLCGASPLLLACAYLLGALNVLVSVTIYRSRRFL